MTDLTPIREYEQAVYVYWLGPNLPTVKIGHTNNPARRLEEFRRETGTPGHKASFAAIVWLDRRREAVELAVHRRLRDQRRDGEWFAVSAEDALAAIVAVAESMNIRYEVEDRADLTGVIARREAEAEAERERAAVEAARTERQRRNAEALHNGQRLIRVNVYVLRRTNGELVSDSEPSFAGRALEYYNREQAQVVAAEQGCKVEFIGLQDRLVRLSKLNPENLTEVERAALADHLAREAAQRKAVQRADEQNKLAAAQRADIQLRNAKMKRIERIVTALSAFLLLLGFLWLVYVYKPDPEVVARHKAVVEACERSGGKYVPNTKFTRGGPECRK